MKAQVSGNMFLILVCWLHRTKWSALFFFSWFPPTFCDSSILL